VEDPESGARDVAEVLKKDPALSAQIIGLANSPANGVRHRIETIEGAASLLGLREVYTVTVAAAVFESFDTKTSYDYSALWRRSAVCGSLAKLLARTSGWKGGGDIYAGGLLQDIGRAVFAEVAPALYNGLDHDVPDDVLIELEHDVFGIAHPEVGYIVSKMWGLPKVLGEVIRFHHRPELAKESPELVRLIALAARLTDHLERPEAVPLASCSEALESLGIEESQVTMLLDIARALRDADSM
jgi:HD-like signal output (HDOD) protein